MSPDGPISRPSPEPTPLAGVGAAGRPGSDDDLEALRREDDRRRGEARRLRSKGRALVGLAFLAGWLFPINLLLLPLIAAAARRAFVDASKLSIPNARVLMSQDLRPPVLYLRSFGDDGSYAGNRVLEPFARLSPLSGANRRRTYEEHLVGAVGAVGPVVAVGRPGEPLPELGASRLYAREDRWKDEVRALMAASRLVVVRVGRSPGLRWELGAAVEGTSPENLVLYLEPRGMFPEEMRDLLPVSALPDVSRARFLHFSPDWTPLAARSIRRVLRAKGLDRVRPRTIILVGILLVMCALIAWFIAANLG